MPKYKPVPTSETEHYNDDDLSESDESCEDNASTDNESESTENNVDDTAEGSGEEPEYSSENVNQQNSKLDSGSDDEHKNSAENVNQENSETGSGSENEHKHSTEKLNQQNGILNNKSDEGRRHSCENIIKHNERLNSGNDDEYKHSAESNNQYNGGLNHNGSTNGLVKETDRKKRAQSARDLVQSQENLILMLQSMKNDLAKMDREATSIKEEVARSRQLFDVVVGHKRLHYLDYSANGYNFTYAMPRVSYTRNRTISDSSRRRLSNLSQISTYNNYSHNTTRRRSSLSSASSRSSYQNNIEYIRSRFGQNVDQKSPPLSQCVTSRSECSETESEYDSEYSPKWSRDPTRNQISVSGMSTDSCVSDSSVTDGRSERLSDREKKTSRRRSSYFFVRKPESPQQEMSDDVCV